MNPKYIGTLTAEKSTFLEELIAKVKTQSYRIYHAQILLELVDQHYSHYEKIVLVIIISLPWVHFINIFR